MRGRERFRERWRGRSGGGSDEDDRPKVPHHAFGAFEISTGKSARPRGMSMYALRDFFVSSNILIELPILFSPTSHHPPFSQTRAHHQQTKERSRRGKGRLTLHNRHSNHTPMQSLIIMITTRLGTRIAEIIQAHPCQHLVVRPGVRVGPPDEFLVDPG